MSNAHHAIVFLVDIDNTLLDNDRVQQDIQDHLERELGAQCRERYWTIQEQLFETLGYRDYLGAVQRFRIERPNDVRLLSIGAYLMNYPFADRLYPGALDVLRHLRTWGPAVILSDGDAVFQPRKAEQSGIAGAADDRVLIYIHKEEALADIEQRYPTDHYDLVDDKLHILNAVKSVWGERVTTVFPRQGKFAHDASIIASNPPADLTVERIGDLLQYDMPALAARDHPIPSIAR